MTTRLVPVIVTVTLVLLVAVTSGSWSKKKRERLRNLEQITADMSPAEWPDFLATFYYPRNFSWKAGSGMKKRRKNRKKNRRRFHRRKHLMGHDEYRWLKSLSRGGPSFNIKNRSLKSFKNNQVNGPRLARLRAPAPPTTTQPPSVVEQLSRATKRSRRPNVILMMADDQDVELGSLQFMPKLNRFLKSGGAHLENGYVTTPMCCPSRSSMLTGLYAHNHNVLTNKENCSSPEWISEHEPHTFAPYMRDAGYKTGYFGKYLNRYDGARIPKGWDEWSGLIRNSKFYNYTLNVNGEKVAHGFDYGKDYFPDLITNDSISFFRTSKENRPDKPIMMVMSYPGPHGPEDSAPQYQDLFFNVTTHHTPAYDYAPNPDKQWILQVTERMDPVQRKFTDVLMTKRLQTLQSIDDAIERLCNELSAIGELDNTYIFYTSDHGYHLGQFGLVKGKAFPFEMDTKVPFFVRGPGIEPGTVRTEPVLNIDLAPTFLDIAGVPAPPHMDGRSVMPTLLKDDVMSVKEKEAKAAWRDSFLLERGKMTSVRYEKIKASIRGSVASRTVGINGTADTSILPPSFVSDPSRDMILLEKPRLTKQERLAAECLKPRFQAPCSTYQRRKCVRKKNGDWRMVNCRKEEDLSYDDSCVCEAATAATPNERRLQREFLKKHTNSAGRQQRKLRHKFLEMDAFAAQAAALGVGYDDIWMRFKRSPYELTRFKRSAPVQETLSDSAALPPNQPEFNREINYANKIKNRFEESSERSNVTAVLEEIAKEEIDEVDIIMEDINDEILDLEQSIHVVVNQTDEATAAEETTEESSGCSVAGAFVNCSSDVYETPSRLEKSKAYVNEQIRRLRSQLFELKEIRKHLQRKQPKLPRQSKTQQTSSSVKKKCVCSKPRHQSGRRQEQRVARRRQLRQRKERRRQMKKAKKIRKEKRKQKRMKDFECPINDEFMNCFTHNNDHWKTQPLWTDGAFCACTNSNTNTYSCVRTINATHNYLYCEFVSGIITYYNLNIDPYQLRNIYQTLSDTELNYMHTQLLALKEYSGQDGKWAGSRGRRTNSVSQGFRRSLSNRRMSSKQRQFNRRYGQMLPSLDTYKPRRSKRRQNSNRNRTNSHHKKQNAWISMLISFKI